MVNPSAEGFFVLPGLALFIYIHIYIYIYIYIYISEILLKKSYEKSAQYQSRANYNSKTR